MSYTTKYRPAVAMIELIFAIVIMGIVLMSAPNLISTATSTTAVALQQEGINEASSRVNMILTYPWDENDKNQSCIPPVLHVTDGDDQLDEVAGSKRRVGVPHESDSHTFFNGCTNVPLNASAIAIDGLDDIDDFIGTTTLTVDISGTGGKDYIEQDTVQIATGVQYSSDNADYDAQNINFVIGTATPAGKTSNIKSIRVVVTTTSTSTELQKNIVLNAFSCNIGGFEYYSKDMP